jgi:cytochrome P450
MTTSLLEMDRVRELFDLRGSYVAALGGGYTDDPYPRWKELREQAAVHVGTPHALQGIEQDLLFQGLPFPDRPHFTAFTYAACEEVLKNPEVFASSPEPVDLDGAAAITNSMISMGGQQHRRYRSLVQPSFLPSRARWWIRNWIEDAVRLLIDHILESGAGRAELNVDFCAAIPVLTITGSFGIGVERALDVRAALKDPDAIIAMVAPIVAARRQEPQDDLISILVQAEMTDEDGATHRLSDAEIYSFALLLLAAGSGTTWKQMGITLTALLQRPQLLERVRTDREVLRRAVEEALRWMPTDPAFARFATRDVELHGVHVPAGSVVHMNFASANRDPARWEDPDAFDVDRKMRASLAFGGGAHICLGMHVARAEILTGINALLDRLPNLRLDPDAEQPAFVGYYERGATSIPVLFDR